MCMTSIVLLFQYLMAVAITSAPLKSSLWICYVDDTFVIWPHYLAPLKRFHEHLKQQCPSIQFTMETKDDGETESPSWRKGGQERTHWRIHPSPEEGGANKHFPTVGKVEFCTCTNLHPWDEHHCNNCSWPWRSWQKNKTLSSFQRTKAMLLCWLKSEDERPTEECQLKTINGQPHH